VADPPRIGRSADPRCRVAGSYGRGVFDAVEEQTEPDVEKSALCIAANYVRVANIISGEPDTRPAATANGLSERVARW
jgi:hypothetical protein